MSFATSIPRDLVVAPSAVRTLTPHSRASRHALAKVYAWGHPFNWSIENIAPAVGWFTDRGIKLSRLYIPNPSSFNKVVIPHFSFDEKMGMKGVTEHGPTSVHGNGNPLVDGVVIQSGGDGVGIFSADCPTIVMTDSRGWMYVAHAGRDSLIHRPSIEATEGASRKSTHLSVVDAIMDKVGPQDPSTLKVLVMLGIRPQHFKHSWFHPRYGSFNRRMTRWVIDRFGPSAVYGDPKNGCLDLGEIVRAQFMAYGVSDEAINTTTYDTFSDHIHREGEGLSLRWASRRRDPKKRERNLVIAMLE